ncbi:MAG: hypothetical protein K6G65_01855 [Lachnospiraceae bacterium]|nr:hypothetical protein [Lachnospiraceae bacterium]
MNKIEKCKLAVGVENFVLGILLLGGGFLLGLVTMLRESGSIVAFLIGFFVALIGLLKLLTALWNVIGKTEEVQLVQFWTNVVEQRARRPGRGYIYVKEYYLEGKRADGISMRFQITESEYCKHIQDDEGVLTVKFYVNSGQVLGTWMVHSVDKENKATVLETNSCKSKEIILERILHDSAFVRMNGISIACLIFAAGLWSVFSVKNLCRTVPNGVQAVAAIGIVLGFGTAFLFYRMEKKHLGDYIEDMTYEELVIKDNTLIHSWSVKSGEYLSETYMGRRDEIKLSEIENCLYDGVTKRVEITGVVKEYHIYGDARVRENKKQNATLVFYDYYEPELIDTLRRNGIIAVETRIPYRIRGAAINDMILDKLM